MPADSDKIGSGKRMVSTQVMTPDAQRLIAGGLLALKLALARAHSKIAENEQNRLAATGRLVGDLTTFIESIGGDGRGFCQLDKAEWDLEPPRRLSVTMIDIERGADPGFLKPSKLSVGPKPEPHNVWLGRAYLCLAVAAQRVGNIVVEGTESPGPRQLTWAEAQDQIATIFVGRPPNRSLKEELRISLIYWRKALDAQQEFITSIANWIYLEGGRDIEENSARAVGTRDTYISFAREIAGGNRAFFHSKRSGKHGG